MLSRCCCHVELSWRVPHVEQEMLTFPEHLISHPQWGPWYWTFTDFYQSALERHSPSILILYNGNLGCEVNPRLCTQMRGTEVHGVHAMVPLLHFTNIFVNCKYFKWYLENFFDQWCQVYCQYMIVKFNLRLTSFEYIDHKRTFQEEQMYCWPCVSLHSIQFFVVVLLLCTAPCTESMSTLSKNPSAMNRAFWCNLVVQKPEQRSDPTDDGIKILLDLFQ